MAIRRIRLRRGTAAAWASANPVLGQGEPGWVTDTGRLYFGDGVTAFADLEPFASGATYTDADVVGVLETELGFDSETGLIDEAHIPTTIARTEDVAATRSVDRLRYVYTSNFNVAAPHPQGASLPANTKIAELLDQDNAAENGTYRTPANPATQPLVKLDAADQLLTAANIGMPVTAENVVSAGVVRPGAWEFVVGRLSGDPVLEFVQGSSVVAQHHTTDPGAWEGTTDGEWVLVTDRDPATGNGLFASIGESSLQRLPVQLRSGTRVVVPSEGEWIFDEDNGATAISAAATGGSSGGLQYVAHFTPESLGVDEDFISGTSFTIDPAPMILPADVHEVIVTGTSNGKDGAYTSTGEVSPGAIGFEFSADQPLVMANRGLPVGVLFDGPSGFVEAAYMVSVVDGDTAMIPWPNPAITEVRSFFGMIVAADLENFGATYDPVTGTLTSAVLGGAVLPGEYAAAFGQPNADINGVWRHQSGNVFLRVGTQPFTLRSVGRTIEARTFVNSEGSSTSPWQARVTGDGTYEEISSDSSTGGTSDKRWGLEALAQEWAESTDLVLRTYPTPESMDGDYDGTWVITNDTNASGTLPHTPDGIDVRIHTFTLLPYRDDELGAGQAWPYQRYREQLTQTKATATGGDLFEIAEAHIDATFSGHVPTTQSFSEHTPQGAPGEVGHPVTGILVTEMGPLIGVPVIKRYTHDVATETITHWRWLPYDTGEAGVETTIDEDDGRVDHWYPVKSWTFEDAGSIDDGGMGDGTYPGGQPDPYRIGIQNRAEFRRMTAHHYGGAKILDIRPEHINAAGVGATSFVDGVGNTISTVVGDIFDPHGEVSAQTRTIGSDEPVQFDDATEQVIATVDVTPWATAIREPGNTVDDTAVSGKWLSFISVRSTAELYPLTSVVMLTSDDGDDWLADTPVLITGELGGDDPFTTTKGGEDPFLAKNPDGTPFRDGDGFLYLYMEEKIYAGHRGVNLYRFKLAAGGAMTDLSLYGRVLDRAGGSVWDSSDRTSPTVLVHSGEFHMLYEGRSFAVSESSPQPGDQLGEVGHATSSDGLAYTADADPVIVRGPEGSWYEKSVVPDAIILDGDRWVVITHGQTSGDVYRSGRFYTTDAPADWDATSFTELPSNPFPDTETLMGYGNDPTWTTRINSSGDFVKARILQPYEVDEPRITAIEVKNAQQDDRLSEVESQSTSNSSGLAGLQSLTVRDEINGRERDRGFIQLYLNTQVLAGTTPVEVTTGTLLDLGSVSPEQFSPLDVSSDLDLAGGATVVFDQSVEGPAAQGAILMVPEEPPVGLEVVAVEIEGAVASGSIDDEFETFLTFGMTNLASAFPVFGVALERDWIWMSYGTDGIIRRAVDAAPTPIVLVPHLSGAGGLLIISSSSAEDPNPVWPTSVQLASVTWHYK